VFPVKTILIIGYMHPKYDKRVFRTVKALSKYAKVVYQYITDNDHVEKTDSSENIIYYPIYWCEDPNTSVFKKLFQRRKLDEQIIELIESMDFDILYMHHFLPSKPLFPFKWAKAHGKKVVFDVHEYHPQNFLANLGGVTGKLKEKFMMTIFKKQLELSDKLIFVSQEVPIEVGVSKDYLIMPNYAEKVNFSVDVQSKIEKKEIVFAGKITRRFQEEKDILLKLIEYGFSLRIIGMDSETFKDIPHMYTNFLPYTEMMKELSKATFSLSSYSTVGRKDYRNDLYSLPHKFYDSLAAKTPVILRDDFVSMRNIVEKFGVGVVINPANVDESVRKIIDAYKNYENLIDNIEKNIDEFTWNETKEREFVKYILDE